MPSGSGEVPSWRCFGGLRGIADSIGDQMEKRGRSEGSNSRSQRESREEETGDANRIESNKMVMIQEGY